jgi:FAD/FMN-containing dehydrogenase
MAMPLEIHIEDQYAMVPSDLSLSDLEAALPANLHYRAPLLGLSAGDWVRSGGFGQLNAPGVRHDVLGLEYRTNDGQSGQGSLVRAGGVVVKNVSGYDLVRFMVASDPGLQREVQLETLILRLRPKPEIWRREMTIEPAQVVAIFEQLRADGAAFGFAFKTGETWRLRAEWWNAQPNWGEQSLEPWPATMLGSSSDSILRLEVQDALGAFPRAARTLSLLEQNLLSAL